MLLINDKIRQEELLKTSHHGMRCQEVLRFAVQIVLALVLESVVEVLCMLENVGSMFDGMLDMMKKLKKASYEKYMEEFRERNGHFFREMIQYVEQKEDKEAAAKEVAVVFTDAVKETFSVRGKIKARTQIDMNFFMIYYVFPAILLEESEVNDLIAGSIRDEWEAKFKDSKIQYADYDRIYGAFREKIFGIF